MDKPKILIVEDDEDLRTQVKWALSADYEVFQAGSRQEALEVFQFQMPMVVTLDLGLPPFPAGVEEGFATLAVILSINPAAKVIVITGRGEKENAMVAVGQGAYDFLVKPVDIDDLKVVLKRAFYLASLENERADLQKQMRADSFEGLLGIDQKMQDIFTTVCKVATTDAPVLICGESGTGKELLAKAIHNRSLRKNGPLVTINCGAIPENLLESELFGHEKGSFTGAHAQRRGRIELAHKGTLFLDEIGELSLKLQVKLLRFLQDQYIDRVGGREQIQVDTRIIAATNKDLKNAMKENIFREDLYYRLAVVVLSIPPLRDRSGDAVLIAKSFLERYAAGNHKKLLGFSGDALRIISTNSWPGNIRELENKIKRAVIMAEGRYVTATDLDMGDTNTRKMLGLKKVREKIEKDLVASILERNRGNLTKTAEELGISRPTLYDLMDKLDIRKKNSVKDL